jgi:hypothetical protein
VRCEGATLTLPCHQVVWNGSGLCWYHERVRDGYLEPTYVSLRPPGWRPAHGPELPVFEDGWHQPSVDLFTELLRRQEGRVDGPWF